METKYFSFQTHVSPTILLPPAPNDQMMLYIMGNKKELVTSYTELTLPRKEIDLNPQSFS